MPFEIRDRFGEPVDNAILNADAMELWEMPVVFWLSEGIHTVYPKGQNLEENWHNNIGCCIEQPYIAGKKRMPQQDWNSVKHSLFNMLTDEWASYKFEDIVKEINNSLVHLSPYFKLMELWESKGYIPVRIP